MVYFIKYNKQYYAFFMSKQNRLFIVDLTDCLYQQWHLEGKPVVITDLFIDKLTQKILDLSSSFQPTHALAVADAPNSWRQKIIKDYQFHGQKIPFHIYKTLGRVEKRLELEGWSKVIRRADLEATDIIWRLLESTKNANNMTKKIISSDKRLLSWVKRGTSIESYYVKYETERRKDKDWVEFKYGVKPDQMTDLLLLTGDRSKNLKGVVGIGPKKAQHLLEEFESVEGIIHNSDGIQGNLGELIRNNKDMIQIKHILEGKEGIDLQMSFNDIRIKHQNELTNEPSLFI